MVELCPIKYFLIRVWELISAKDTNAIFMEPVDLKEVPDYTDVVKHPMDLSTIKYKIDNFQYSSVEDLEMDFNLMISNCLAYNAKDTIFYRAGIRMRDQGGSIIKSARKDAEIAGLDDETGLLMEPGAIKSGKSSEEKLVKEIDSQLESLKSDDLVSVTVVGYLEAINTRALLYPLLISGVGRKNDKTHGFSRSSANFKTRASERQEMSFDQNGNGKTETPSLYA